MSAEADLLAMLEAHGPLTAIVGTEIHRDVMPESGAFPCVVFARSSTEPVATIHGLVPAEFVTFQIHCNAETGGTASALADEVEAALITGGEIPEGRAGGYDPDSGMHVYPLSVTLLQTT